MKTRRHLDYGVSDAENIPIDDDDCYDDGPVICSDGVCRDYWNSDGLLDSCYPQY